MHTDNKYILANNATAVLSSPVNESATSIFLQDSTQSLIAALSEVSTSTWGGAERQTRAFLTLCDHAESRHEVVEVVSFDAGTQVVGVVRAQDGTTAQSWGADDKAEMRINAGLLAQLTAGKAENSISIGRNNGGEGSHSVQIGDLAQAIGSNSISIGKQSGADDGDITDSIAIGPLAVATNGGIAIGAEVTAGYIDEAPPNVMIGKGCYSVSHSNVGIGRNIYLGSSRCVAIGKAGAYQNDSIAIGEEAESWLNYAMALGNNAKALVSHSIHLAAIPYLPAAKRLPSPLPSGDIATRHRSAPNVTLATGILHLTSEGDSYTIEIPSGARFYPKSAELIITGVDGAGGSPAIHIGTDADNAANIMASTAITVTSEFQMQTLILDTSNGVESVYVSVSTAGSGVAFNCRVLISGYLIENENEVTPGPPPAGDVQSYIGGHMVGESTIG